MSEKKESNLEEKIDKINYKLYQKNIIELSEILGNTKKMVFRNFLAGISKGIGIGIGFTILTAILLYILQKIVRLNIPVIGKYISDIAEIVENSSRTLKKAERTNWDGQMGTGIKCSNKKMIEREIFICSQNFYIYILDE